MMAGADILIHDDAPLERAHPTTSQLLRERFGIVAISSWFLLLAWILVPALIELTSAAEHAATDGTITEVSLPLLGGLLHNVHSTEEALVLLVLVAGATGGLLQALTTFLKDVAAGRLTRAAYAWYLFQPLVGALLAGVVYAVLRGGLMGSSGSQTTHNPFGLLAMSALVGMFSRRAIDRLSEIFDTLFAPRAPPRSEGREDQPLRKG